MPPGLWVVATPIGNLGELSERARGALAQADAIYCEDTRRTGTLLTACGISGKSLHRLDAHASPRDVAQAVERMRAGESLAYVTDAGTPAVSDPGQLLVAAAREAGVRVTPVAGPSAVTALLSVSGFAGTEFVFRGFFPRKNSEREAELKLALEGARLGISRIWFWFESPERIVSALEAVASRAPEGARVIAAKELTKLHERVFAGNREETASQVREEIEREGARGEWCFALEVAAAARSDAGEGESDESWGRALICLVNAGVSASEAARQVSQVFGIGKNPVYERALQLSGKKK